MAELRARLDPGHPGRLGRRAAAPAALREWDGTFVQAATPFLADLVRVVEAGEEAAPPALRIFVVTGAAVPRALAERATTVLSAAVCGAWGSTESCLGALAAPGDDPAKVWGTDGRALAGTRIRIVDDDDQRARPRRGGQLPGDHAAASSRSTSTVPT